MTGEWTLLPHKSAQIDLFEGLTLKIKCEAGEIGIDQVWGIDHYHRDQSVNVPTDGSVRESVIPERAWTPQPFLGVSMKVGGMQKASATVSEDGRQVTVKRSYPILVSQGPSELETTEIYTLGPADETLTLKVSRPTRTTGPEELYTFKRAGTKQAHMMRLKDQWDVATNIDDNILLLSLQGVANKDAARLYFLYPEDWAFRFTKPMFDYYETQIDYTFTEILTVEEALKTFKDQIKGYIVWDKEVRGSIDVAFTLAGLEHGVVISPSQMALAEKLDLPLIADLRGEYAGLNDEELYRKAYEKYGERCSREVIVWNGGEWDPQMKPAIVDYGIAKGAFINNLSTRKSDEGEYALAKEIVSKQKPYTMVFGWHSYHKDSEHDYVTLMSNHALRIEGLNTFPNLSFTSQTPPSPGFQFTNHHNLVPGKEYKPEKKVYITCLQTDSLGMGAWTKPGRGDIPYAWETPINWHWMAPVMLEYYYSSATENDFFIGALGGPGYMYPKAIPSDKLPTLVSMAGSLMRKLDLNVFETMDYSEGATLRGNSELPREIVDAYYAGMPDAIGFLNGYAPAYTFTSREGRPFVSFDYYLSRDRPEADAAADLEELARLNPKRPYFLLMHIREKSDISRVKNILDRLGPEFEVVPMDIFLKLAGQEPTFAERYYPSNEAPEK